MNTKEREELYKLGMPFTAAGIIIGLILGAILGIGIGLLIGLLL